MPVSFRSWASLVFALAWSLPAGASTLPPLVWRGPSGQAPTVAQDDQRCGTLLLPPRIQLVTQVPSSLHRTGRWETVDGATLNTWQQDFFSWSPKDVFYGRGTKSLFKAINVGDNVSLQDCEGAPMYLLSTYGATYDIFDTRGQLVAEGRYGASEYFPKQFFFSDEYGEPIAVAQSPAVEQPLSYSGYSEFHDEASVKATQQLLWQVIFYGASTTNSSLIHAQRRWVVVAAIQDLVLRMDERERAIPNWRPIFMATWLLVFGAFGLLLCAPVYFVLNAILAKPVERYPIVNDDKVYDYGGLRGRVPTKGPIAAA